MPGAALLLRPGDVVRIRDDTWRVLRYAPYDGVAIVEVSGCGRRNAAVAGRFVLPFEPVNRLTAASKPRLVRPARWRRLARRVLADAAPSPVCLRAALRADLTLVPFQLEPALAVLRGDACRVLLADAVGLGKTVQAGLIAAELLHRHPEARVLVVTPASLREQWRGELRGRFGIDARVLDAAGIARAAAVLPDAVNPWSVDAAAITSIDYVKRPEVMRALEALTWDLAVFDEAHHLASRSDRASAAAALAGRARAVVLLTATPHSGDEAAFQRLCHLGCLTEAAPPLVFRRTRRDAGLAGARRAVLLHVRTTAAEQAMHAALADYARAAWMHTAAHRDAGARLAVTVLMRRACSSAASLARSVERRLARLATMPIAHAEQFALPFAMVDDEEPDVVLACPALGDRSDELARLTLVLDLARSAAAGESKPAALRRLLRRTAEPALVFTEYRDTLLRLRASLPELPCAELHGGQTARERAEVVARFTAGDVRVLLATDAASEGLNLHHRCRLVVNLELPWNPLRLEQRIGRVDRLGQTRCVHAVHLVARATCEQSVLSRLARRVDRIAAAVGLPGVLPDERRIADSAFGGAALPEIAAGRHVGGTGALPPDLSPLACEEAARLQRGRAWLRAAGDGANPERAVLTRLDPRRTTLARGHRLWVFRLLLTDAAGRVIWESVLPLGTRAAIAGRLDPARLRTLLADPRVDDVAAAAAAGMVGFAAQALHAPLALGERRELELMAAFTARRARLSAAVLQRGLFDRRADRLAAAQTRLLDEAVQRSARHLDELAAARHLSIGGRSLVFAFAVA